MKRFNRKHCTGLLQVLIWMLSTRLCGQIAGGNNYTLGSEQKVWGNLYILAQNAILENGSTVDRSVVMLCCNLTVNGTVGGNVFLMTGNLRLDSRAEVSGTASVLSGNLSQ